MTERPSVASLAPHLVLIVAGFAVSGRVGRLAGSDAPTDGLAIAVSATCAAVTGIAALAVVAAVVGWAMRADDRDAATVTASPSAVTARSGRAADRSAVEHDELVAGVVEGHRTVVGGDHDVLQPHAVLAGDVDARLHRVGVTGA